MGNQFCLRELISYSAPPGSICIHCSVFWSFCCVFESLSRMSLPLWASSLCSVNKADLRKIWIGKFIWSDVGVLLHVVMMNWYCPVGFVFWYLLSLMFCMSKIAMLWSLPVNHPQWAKQHEFTTVLKCFPVFSTKMTSSLLTGCCVLSCLLLGGRRSAVLICSLSPWILKPFD